MSEKTTTTIKIETAADGSVAVTIEAAGPVTVSGCDGDGQVQARGGGGGPDGKPD